MLEEPIQPDRLYRAVDEEVISVRPIFTGDVYQSVDIPGVGVSAAIIIAHPCSIRGDSASERNQVQVASVEQHRYHPNDRWDTGFFDRMPLLGLPLKGDFHVAHLDQLGLVSINSLRQVTRIACLSHPGINQLQQRLVFHLTRHAIPVGNFHIAFAHTYEEADLLEEWTLRLGGIEHSPATSFEAWIRKDNPSRQIRLRDPAKRAPIRQEMETEIRARLSRKPD